MKVVPIGANVVVKRLAAEEKTAGGIVLPDAAREKPRQGRVLSLGDGRLLAQRGPRPASGQRRRPRAVQQLCRHRSRRQRRGLLIMSEDEILAVVL